MKRIIADCPQNITQNYVMTKNKCIFKVAVMVISILLIMDFAIILLVTSSSLPNINSHKELSNIKLYRKMKASHCVFYYTNEGRFGCKATGVPEFGIIYGVFVNSDIRKFIYDDKVLSKKYSIVMPYKLFTPDNVKALINTKRVTGIVLVSQNGGYFPSPESWSPAGMSPNFYYGLYRNLPGFNHSWNPIGNNVLTSSFDINISTVTNNKNSRDDTIEGLMEAIAYNTKKKYSGTVLKAIVYKSRFELPFDGSCIKDRKISRDVCSPVGGQSVWATFSENISYDDGKPIIIIASKIDPVGLGRTMNSGTETTKTSIAAVIAIANSIRALREVNGRDSLTMTKHVIFSFFYGESFGFSGSKTFVKDIINDLECLNRNKDPKICPVPNANCTNPCFYSTHFKSINLNNLEYILELDSVANLYSDNPTTSATYYMHTYQNNPQNEKLQEKFSGVHDSPDSTVPQFSVTIESANKSGASNRGIPPSSIMSFLERKNVPAIVFSSYKDKFTNPFYLSDIDSKNTWQQEHIAYMCTLVEAISIAVFKDISGITDDKFKRPNTNCMLIDNVLSCLTNKPNCNIAKAVLNDHSILNDLDSNGDAFVYKIKPISYVINRIMNLVTRTKIDRNCLRDSDCKEGFLCASYKLVGAERKGTCIHGLSFYHRAYSPGIDYDPREMIYKISDASLGTWTSSVRMKSTSYIINILSLKFQIFQLVLGVSTTTVFSLVVYYFKNFLSNLIS